MPKEAKKAPSAPRKKKEKVFDLYCRSCGEEFASADKVSVEKPCQNCNQASVEQKPDIED